MILKFDHNKARILKYLCQVLLNISLMISKIHPKMVKNAINGKKRKIVLPYIITCFQKMYRTSRN